MIVLAAPDTDPAQLEYALEWVHYLVDPPTTEWGAMRARNGHPEPYDVPLHPDRQRADEPQALTRNATPRSSTSMARRLRQIAPQATIVACGQKRSNDMSWSEKLIDLAGQNFDILGIHNYEYESDRTSRPACGGSSDYLVKLATTCARRRIRTSEIAVLEWSLSRTYDWRAGLHAAGSLMLYETLAPALAMTAPALLMRNTTDDPSGRALIYHDHVSWFPGAAYVVQKLFREHYAETYWPRRAARSATSTGGWFFDEISHGEARRLAARDRGCDCDGSADGRRIVIKAVNYDASRHTLLVRLQGSRVPAAATVTIHTITAAPTDAASLAAPDTIRPVARSLPWSPDQAIDLEPHSVAVVAITAR